MLKIDILERLVASDLFTRFFKVNIFAKQTVNVTQYHSGGDDYNPPPKCEGLGDNIGGNPKNGVVFAWRDETPRVAAPGEKRIYSVNVQTGEVAAVLHLKNDGTAVLTGTTLQMNFTDIQSVGSWQHTGTMSITGDTDITGNLSASHIEAADGKDGVLDKPKFTKGIATGGS